jgi:hypothetical protein
MRRISSLIVCVLVGVLGGIVTMQFSPQYAGMVTVIAVILIVLLVTFRWRLWRSMGLRQRRRSPVSVRARSAKRIAPGRK